MAVAIRLVMSALLLAVLHPVIVTAAVVGDRVELKARHHAGVPLHQAPRGTADFQRVPDGTVAAVTAVAENGRWLQLSPLSTHVSI